MKDCDLYDNTVRKRKLSNASDYEYDKSSNFQGLNSSLSVVKNAWYYREYVVHTEKETVGEDEYSKVIYKSGTVVFYKNGVIHRDGEPAIIHASQDHADGYKQWIFEGILYAQQGTWEKKQQIVKQDLFKKAMKVNKKNLNKLQTSNANIPPVVTASKEEINKDISKQQKVSTQKRIVTSKQKEKFLSQAQQSITPAKGVKGLLFKHIQNNLEIEAENLGFEGFSANLRSYLICLEDQISIGKKNYRSLKRELDKYQNSFSVNNINQLLSAYSVSAQEESVCLSLNFLAENNIEFNIPDSIDFDEDNSVLNGKQIIEKWDNLQKDVICLLEDFFKLPQNCSVGNISDLKTIGCNMANLYNSPIIDEKFKKYGDFFDYGFDRKQTNFRIKDVDGKAKMFFISPTDKKALDPVKEIWYQELQKTFSLDIVRKLLIQIEDINSSMVNLQTGLSERSTLFIKHIEEQIIDVQRQYHHQTNDGEGVFDDIKAARQTLNKFIA